MEVSRTERLRLTCLLTYLLTYLFFAHQIYLVTEDRLQNQNALILPVAPFMYGRRCYYQRR